MTVLDTKAKLRWACRRGMLELDVLLMPFIDDNAYDALPDAKKLVFQRLLTSDDPDLFAWFMGHQACEDAELKDMVGIILNRVRV
jgi:antitoxin CptB